MNGHRSTVGRIPRVNHPPRAERAGAGCAAAAARPARAAPAARTAHTASSYTDRHGPLVVLLFSLTHNYRALSSDAIVALALPRHRPREAASVWVRV